MATVKSQVFEHFSHKNSLILSNFDFFKVDGFEVLANTLSCLINVAVLINVAMGKTRKIDKHGDTQ